jgi:hypothetical protein
MRLLLFLLTLLFASLRASTPSSLDDNPYFFHHVHVISGHLQLSIQDLVVEGAHPFALTRTYSSSGALEIERNSDLVQASLRKGWMVQGGWTLLPHIHPTDEKRNYKAFVAEPSGTVIAYTYNKSEGHGKLSLKPKRSSFQASGQLGAQSDPSNNLLYMAGA